MNAVLEPALARNATRGREVLLLFLNWPGRTDRLPDEARRFHEWLLEHYAGLHVVQYYCSEASLAAFFASNAEIIDACRDLKPQSGSHGARRAQRVSMIGQAIAFVFDCAANHAIVGSSMRGYIADLSATGVRVEVSGPLPQDTLLSLTLIPPGLPVTLYNLSGVVRWSREADRGHSLGLELFDTEDFQKWCARVDALLVDN